ncbi:DNA recombination protein RmuC [Falsiroseomonas sp.]|uniref:DNA recombination protein RmuC n=1 Tax=Falsiroseomonas sp. TaxID=2870721 RepID=UPI0034A39A20
MPAEMPTLLAAAAALFSLLALLVVLFRRPPPPARDPVLEAALQRMEAIQQRQETALAVLPADLRAEIGQRTSEVAEKLTAQVLDQTKALNGTLAEHAKRHGDSAAALKQDLATFGGEVKTALAEGSAKARQALAEDMTTARDLIERKATESRDQLEAKLKEMREANDARLADIQKSVNEQLQSAVEKQMAESFQRVIDQFDAVQRSMVEVQAVTGQIGDLKRLFSNVKARGGWGEAQCKALLEDILPGGFVENFRPGDTGGETVEFAIIMPTKGETPLHLPLDAKFPVEDYERLLIAAESGDGEGERAARRALGERVRRQGADIAAKYIREPLTTDFAILYLPSDSLYAEVARIPGLLAEIGRAQKVLVVGPSLLPAMLRTIQLGHYSLALSRNADAVRDLLGATKTEMQKMDAVLTKLGKQAGTFGTTIEKAQIRTRAIGRKLRGVDAITFERSEQLLELEAEAPLEDDETA